MISKEIIIITRQEFNKCLEDVYFLKSDDGYLKEDVINKIMERNIK